MAEHHDGIAWRYLCVTIHEDSLAVAHQTTNGDAKWQSKVFYRLSCHLRTLGCYKFGHVGLNHHQRTHVPDVGFHHHLEDMACGYGLLVDNRADVKSFRHADVIQVLDHGNRLAYAQFLGCQTGQDIGLGITCQGYKCLCMPDTFLVKQSQVASVTMNHHGIIGSK